MKQHNKVAVVYHGYCADGFSAAILAKKALVAAGCRVSLFPARHGAPPHPAVVRHDGIVMVDFCYPAEVMAELKNSVTEGQFLCLDHHATARPIIEGQPWGVFDDQRAGVELAWDQFHSGPYPDIVKWIADRDLWRWSCPESRAFGRALAQEPWDETRWSHLLFSADAAELQEMVRKGNIIDDYVNSLTGAMARKAIPLTLAGQDGWAVEAPGAFASDVGAVVSEQKGSFAAIWQITEEGKTLEVRLRSADSNVANVAVLAEKYGGGGHPRAAGFRMPSAALQSLLQGRIS